MQGIYITMPKSESTSRENGNIFELLPPSEKEQ